MPGHTPQEKARNAADISTQPGPDRSGGAAAIPNDPGFTDRFKKWSEFLGRPEVRAGLLQFSSQILQTNPGGVVPAFGQALGAGLGAAGRVSALGREQEQAGVEQAQEAAQLQLENALDERRVATQEQRTSILGRQRAGGGVVAAGGIGGAELEKQYGPFVDELFAPDFGEVGLSPIERTKFMLAAATADKNGDISTLKAFNATPEGQKDPLSLSGLLQDYAVNPEIAHRGLLRAIGQEEIPAAGRETGGAEETGGNLGPAQRPPVAERTATVEAERRKGLLQTSFKAAVEGTDTIEQAARRVINSKLLDDTALEVLAADFPTLLAAIQKLRGADGQ